MENQSPFLLVKQLETQIKGTLAAIDTYELELVERKAVDELKREIVDTRLDIRDYELSETRQEQLGYAAAATKRLESLRSLILTVSAYNIFSAIDVAHLTAKLEQIIERIE